MKGKQKKKILTAVLTFGLMSAVFGPEAFAENPAEETEWTEQAERSSGETEISAEIADRVADAGEMTAVEEVVEEGMVPVYAEELKEGTYDVEMKSSSSMFKIDHAVLHVEEGKMSVSLYMTSKSYLYMFAGTAVEAAGAEEQDYIPLCPADDDMGIFELPLEALDAGLPYASFSKKKEKWYDRTLLFRADSLPEEAFLVSRYTHLADLDLQDGEYLAEVRLEGGSGRAKIESPARLTVSGDSCMAEIIWGSPNYDYMVVDGQRYDPVNTEGNSVFVIPVSGFDGNLQVQADTTAMSQPYLIDYTLCFDSSTLVPAS